MLLLDQVHEWYLSVSLCACVVIAHLKPWWTIDCRKYVVRMHALKVVLSEWKWINENTGIYVESQDEDSK